jgi:tetratricopeptide (TPR) repeat protein
VKSASAGISGGREKVKPAAASTSNDRGIAEQPSDHSKDAIPCQQINVQMVQNVLLIWLDNNIDDNSAHYRNRINRLRRAVNTINTFTDGDQCIQFLKNMGNDKAFMIISGSLGQQIVPRVHNMSQVNSIFIFSSKKKRHEQWIKDWFKIKGVSTEITHIFEGIKQAAQQCEQNSISISIMSTTDDVSKKNLDQFDSSFMYTQIFKEILLTIKFEEKHIIEFIEYCRDVFAENQGELKNVDKLQRNYRDETPIWWYTYECFLYPMLNRALRLMDMNIIIKMGFFIDDLHHHIERLYSEQFGGNNSDKSFTVYRGQGMSTTDFEQMTKAKGGLMSFNNFLFTSKNHTVSFEFANRALSNPDLVGILFVMTIDPAKSTTPFASIADVSCDKNKDEILFAMQTVFRICDIKPMDENQRLFQVELALTNDNDKDLLALTDRIREETFPNSEGWYRLGLALIKMGQFDRAQEVYEILLEQKTNENEKASIYGQLAWAKYKQGKYNDAITFYENSLEIYKKALPSNHLYLAYSYNNIGGVYNTMGEYQKALWHYKKDLEISRKLLPPNDPDLASSYNNIGGVYDAMGEYSEALSYYEKDLEISQKTLLPCDPDLASSYNKIGNVYYNIGEYSKALLSHEKALEIRQKSLTPNHPSLAYFCNNIGNVYFNMSEYSKALYYYEKDLEINQQILPQNHPDLAMSNNNIGLVYEKMDNYSKARSFYETAVDIGQQSSPVNEPELKKYRENLNRVKMKL